MKPNRTTNALDPLTPLSLLRMMWKGRILIFWVWAGVTSAVLVYVSRLPPSYTAEATVVVDSQKIPDRYVASTVNTDLQDRLANISQEILSSARLQKIMDDFGLYREERRQLSPEEVAEKMRKAITIQAEVRAFTGSRVGAFKVGFRGPDPTVVAGVANRISNLYVEENLRTREVEAQGTEEFIDNQLQEAKKTLDDLEAAVSRFKLEHNGELPQQQADISAALGRLQVIYEANRDAISRAQQTKLTLESSLNMAEANLSVVSAALETAHSDGESTVILNGAVRPSAPAPNFRRLSETIEQQIDVASARYGPSHPEMIRLRAELAAARSAEQKQETESVAPAQTVNTRASEGRGNSVAVTMTPVDAPVTRAGTGEASKAPNRTARLTSIRNDLQLAPARERVTAVRSQIQIATKEIEERNADQAKILKEIAVYQARLQRLPIREQEMAQITRDYEIAKANYRSLLDKRLSAGMATAMEHREKSERFEIIDPAQIPSKPATPNRPLLNCAGGLSGLVFGILIAVALQLHRNVVLGAWELPAGIPLLGSVPVIDVSSFSEARASFTHVRWKTRLAIVCVVAFSLVAILAGAYAWAHRS